MKIIKITILLLLCAFYAGGQDVTTRLKSAIDEQKVIPDARQAKQPRSGYISGLYRKVNGCWYERLDTGIERLVTCSDGVATLTYAQDTLTINNGGIDRKVEIKQTPCDSTIYDIQTERLDCYFNGIVTRTQSIPINWKYIRAQEVGWANDSTQLIYYAENQLATITATDTLPASGEIFPFEGNLFYASTGKVPNVKSELDGHYSIFNTSNGKPALFPNPTYGDSLHQKIYHIAFGEKWLDVEDRITIGKKAESATDNLPTGTTNQTLRHNGTDWAATSSLLNDGVGGLTNTSTGTNASVLLQNTSTGNTATDGALLSQVGNALIINNQEASVLALQVEGVSNLTTNNSRAITFTGYTTGQQLAGVDFYDLRVNGAGQVMNKPIQEPVLLKLVSAVQALAPSGQTTEGFTVPERLNNWTLKEVYYSVTTASDQGFFVFTSITPTGGGGVNTMTGNFLATETTATVVGGTQLVSTGDLITFEFDNYTGTNPEGFDAYLVFQKNN